MLKKYTMGFNPLALVLFALIMAPTIIWSFIPAPDDILRVDSATPILDIIANICRVVMLFALCAFIHSERKAHTVSPMIVCTLCCILIYYTAWISYYSGSSGAAAIIGMTLPPCLAFIFYSIDRKNILALVPAAVFTVCHAVYAAVNFIIP